MSHVSFPPILIYRWPKLAKKIGKNVRAPSYRRNASECIFISQVFTS